MNEPGPAPYAMPSKIPDAQPRGGEQRVDLAEDELGVTLAGVQRALVDDAGDADGEREPIGRRLDREEVHAADSIGHGRATLCRRGREETG